jgi:hypothetical protein
MDPLEKKILEKRIRNADLLPDDKDLLLKRLSVASHEGIAAVVRDFEVFMQKRRISMLQSHRRFHEGRFGSDKRAVTLNIA